MTEEEEKLINDIDLQLMYFESACHPYSEPTTSHFRHVYTSKIYQLIKDFIRGTKND